MKITSDDFGRKFYDTCGNTYSIFRVIGSVIELFQDGHVSIHRLVGKEFLYKSGGDYISIGLHFDRWADEPATDQVADQDRPKDLRDEFAMVALGGMVPTEGYRITHKDTAPIIEEMATVAYLIADAMMEARGK